MNVSREAAEQPRGTEAVDIVGDRSLLAVQAVNISRLSTHPVPIVPGTLLVVAGQGPKDSNGAGKSSFIAAITALLGDEQWRFASGAQSIAELLFNAELAAQGDSHWASADHGYIAGVFAAPDLTQVITVWLRVNVDAPHLQLRWTSGVHLAAAASEADRVRLADERWAELPKSAGRRDFVAKDLGRVLYGNRVRCVSFLSTSVRSRVATNLLSQPLNEITPERIFGAIAALTGLDRELEAERKARTDEHAERTRAAEALDRLEAWERETAALLEAFDRRDRARARLLEGLEHWRTRAARLLVDGAEDDSRLEADLATERRRIGEASAALEAVNDSISSLKDDQLDRELAGAVKTHALVQEQLTALGEDRAVTTSRLDETRARTAALTEAARDADGRDVPGAEAELEAADLVLASAREAVGAAKGGLATAEAQLQAAKSGISAAPPQLGALSSADIPAAAPPDAVLLVVAEPDLADATEALRTYPGSVLLSSNGISAPAGGTEIRHTQAVVIGELTRHDARIAACFEAVATGRKALEAAEAAVRTAASDRDTAMRRLAGARAAGEAAELQARVDTLRRHLEHITQQARAIEPVLNAAEQALRTVRAKADNRDLQVGMLAKDRERYTETRSAARQNAARLADERLDLALDARRTAWGGTDDSARERLSSLEARQRTWDAGAWWHEAESALSDAIRAVFPDGPSDPDMPEQVRLELSYRRDGEGTPTQREQQTFERLAEGLSSYLRRQEEYEGHQRAQIESQRAARRADFDAAQKGVTEAAGAAAMGRATVTKAIRSRLQRVAACFDELDTAYGGYGATIDFPTPEPPSDPEQDWRWRVVPAWRRSEGQPHVPYNRRANTALMDEKAVKLVCAAALASAGGANLCLVLDELGRNLGKEHRREAVALFRQIGESHGITVIGALQDDMEPYAIDACGEYVKLRRRSDAMPYNEPPVVIGHDTHAERVRLLADAVTVTGAVPGADAGD